jgi:hypothetical protein
MANPEHLAKLKEGVEAWNRWREENSLLRPDLTRADIQRADLIGANLSLADLREANLSGANLTYADLSEAHLRRADLSNADLRGAKLNNANLLAAFIRANLFGAGLQGADLREANLSGTNLSLANLTGADLSRANFTGAELSRATFASTNFGATQLKGATWLDSCVHRGPSYLDYFTLQLSWPLPLAFLRGCGLPDQYIEYLPSLLNQAIQFYSCFISYSTEDQEFADRLYADLQNKGVRCWFASHDIQGGKKIHEQIEEAIRVYERLLLIISEHSMSSRWVKTEIANARKKELEQKRQVLFPIRLVSFEAILAWKLFDADIGDSTASEIREYFIPDFSNWKNHDAYQKALNDLLRDLKAQPSADAASAAP